MNLSNERIESRDRFAVEMHSLSGLVRTDGQQYGTQINRLDAPQTLLPARLMDFVSLTKPEVLLLVLIATGAGCLMASATIDPLVLFNALVGTALVAGGTAALNHYAERAFDGRMRRTAIYDITAKTVYMPNGERLEAHSGLGEMMDDPRFKHVRMRGVTPPNTYMVQGAIVGKTAEAERLVREITFGAPPDASGFSQLSFEGSY